MQSILRLVLFTIMATTVAFSCPKIHVIESVVRSKAGECLHACEDDFVVTPDFACVVDGATSPTGRKWINEWTGGQWAAKVLCRAVQDELKPEMSSAREIVVTLTNSLHSAYQREEGALEAMTRYPEERATASLVLYSKSLRQVIIVGDCQAAFLDANGHVIQRIQPDRYVDQVTSQARAMYWQAELLVSDESDNRGANDDPGRDLIQPLLVRQRRFQNNVKAPPLYRYWAMDGFPIDEKEGIQIYDVPHDVKEIILASDGYPKLYSTLQETEKHLRELLRTDPMMVDRYLAAKGVRQGAESFDDRTFLRLRIDSDDDGLARRSAT